MAVRYLAKAELVHARAALEDIFETLDPFDEPFKATVAERLILYPAQGYELRDSAWSALAAAALAVGETSAYYATVEGQAAREVEPVWEVALDENAQAWFESSASDGSRNPIAESALWSGRGTWGLLVSHEQHVVIGGSSEFVNQLLTQVPDADEQVATFIHDLGHYPSDIERRVPWQPRLLVHIYGRGKADELLRASDDQAGR